MVRNVAVGLGWLWVVGSFAVGCGGATKGADTGGGDDDLEMSGSETVHTDAVVGDVGLDGLERDAGEVEVVGDVGDVAGGDLAGGDVGDARPYYPLDDVLKLNQIQVKGTHNSYHKIPAELPSPEWNYEHAPLAVQLEEQGVRQVELDVHWEPGVGFRVFHLPILDPESTCDTFVECLAELKGWSDAHPGHVPLFVLVEPKDDIDPPSKSIVGHYRDLDAEIFSVWPRERIVTPEDVRGQYESLDESVRSGGWPTLGFCRDKVVFIMLDQEKHSTNYLAEDPDQIGRPIFIRAEVGQAWAAFVEVGNPVSGKEQIAGWVELGYMLRTSSDSTDPTKAEGNPAMAEDAMESGAHLISSDFPAKVGDGYWFDLGGGLPVRCNPLTAPPECMSEVLENLGH